MVAFSGPINALEWAVTLQLALLRCASLLIAKVNNMCSDYRSLALQGELARCHEGDALI